MKPIFSIKRLGAARRMNHGRTLPRFLAFASWETALSGGWELLSSSLPASLLDIAQRDPSS